MKQQLSISIDDGVYNLTLKDQRNKSKYIEQLLKEQYTEDHKVSIAKAVANQLKNDDDFKRSVKGLCHDYMEERRSGYWND